MTCDREWIFEAATAYEIGLAPHYPLLWSVIHGMEPSHVFEFGVGQSSRVILSAIHGGVLWSCSPDILALDKVGVASPTREYGFWAVPGFLSPWYHYNRMTSADALAALPPEQTFDVVLHDGSHNAGTVEADLRTILPRVTRYGLVLIHDTQHSHFGPGMAHAVVSALSTRRHSRVTLPYGFGLTIARIEDERQPGEIRLRRLKVGSPHTTEPGPV